MRFDHNVRAKLYCQHTCAISLDVALQMHTHYSLAVCFDCDSLIERATYTKSLNRTRKLTSKITTRKRDLVTFVHDASLLIELSLLVRHDYNVESLQRSTKDIIETTLQRELKRNALAIKRAKSKVIA